MIDRAKTVTDLGDRTASLQLMVAADIMDALSKHPFSAKYLQDSFHTLWKCVVRDTERMDSELAAKVRITNPDGLLGYEVELEG